MTRVQFLNELYRRLGGMSREAAEQHLTYYAEMLADRMEEGMSEEEAVASLEDVETIASRILQEEGVQDSGGAAPPVYPDPPAVERAAEEGDAPPDTVPAAKKRRRWVLPAVIAVVLCAAGLSLLAGSRASRRGVTINDDGVYVGNILSIDNDGIRVGDFLYIGPDGIRVGSAASTAETSNTAQWAEEDVVVPGGGSAGIITSTERAAYGSSDGDYRVAVQGLSEIKVDWISGDVFIEVWDEDEICFSEVSTVDLDEQTRLYYTVDGNELEIKFSRRSLKNFTGTKQLCLYIPQSLADSLEKLEVDTTSADVIVNYVDTGKLSLETTSGSCWISGNYGSVEADTTSGDVTLEGSARELEFDSTSGDLYFIGEGTLYSVEAETISGDIMLTLPTDGFTLSFETVSGSLDQGSYALTRSNSKRAYTSGDGSCRIEVETVSGNLWLL